MEQQTHPEGSPWFWKLFGGTIIGFIGVLLMLIINNISGNVISMRSEIMNFVAHNKTEQDLQFTKIKDDVSDLKSKLSALEEFRNITKEKTLTDMTSMKDNQKEVDKQIRELREKIVVLESQVKLNEKN